MSYHSGKDCVYPTKAFHLEGHGALVSGLITRVSGVIQGFTGLVSMQKISLTAQPSTLNLKPY